MLGNSSLACFFWSFGGEHVRLALTVSGHSVVDCSVLAESQDNKQT